MEQHSLTTIRIFSINLKQRAENWLRKLASKTGFELHTFQKKTSKKRLLKVQINPENINFTLRKNKQLFSTTKKTLITCVNETIFLNEPGPPLLF